MASILSKLNQCLPIGRSQTTDPQAAPSSSQPAAGRNDRPGTLSRTAAFLHLQPRRSPGGALSQGGVAASGSGLPITNETGQLPRRASLPPRRPLDDKLAQVQARLAVHPATELRGYAHAAVALGVQNKAAGSLMTIMDMQQMGTMLSAENARNPGLNATHHKSIDSFLDALPAMEKGSSARAVIQLDSPDFDMPQLHHITADLRKHDDGNTTMVLVEPAVVADRQITMLQKLHDEMQGRGIDTSHVGIIEAAVQKSSNDCAMFSLNFAVKSHKNKAHFDQLHQNLLQHRDLTPGSASAQAVMDLEVVKVRTSNHQMLTPEENELLIDSRMTFASGQQKLPDDFYKHTHSSAVAGAIQGSAAEARVAAGLQQPDGRVNSGKHELGETLTERVARLKTTRTNDKGSQINASVSIDGYRLQEIARALDAERSGQPGAVSKGATVMNPQGGRS